MESQLPLSFIVVNYNSGRCTLDCLESIRRHAACVPHEIIVVDNASTDGSADLIEQTFPNLLLLRLEKNQGFGAGNNRGAAHARGRYLFLLNNDALLTETAIPPLMDCLESDRSIAVAGPEIHYPDGRYQLSSGRDHNLWREFITKFFSSWRSRLLQKGPWLQSVDWVSGAAMMIPAHIYQRIGGFDERYFLYMEDADLCRRIRKLGYRVVLNRRSLVLHHLGQTTSRIRSELLPAVKRGQLLYYACHNSRLSHFLLKIYLSFQFLGRRSLSPEIHRQIKDVIKRSKPCRT